MKDALLLNVVNPQIGGVLIRGEKGTAKSTAVRSLAELLPDGSGVVDLPISATEDRVVGTLDIEHALKTGEKRFEPGILAHAHENILYVDEVNLLEDHIVDILLDAAAMGVNVVEREGVSYTHPARFILVGTMNPEEGDLRPQLMDRFGLVVDVTGEQDLQLRTEVVRERLKFEQEPEALLADHAEQQNALRTKVADARKRIGQVSIPDDMLCMAARIAIACEVDGHRADITLIKAACARAALDGKDTIDAQDLQACAPLVLPHRLKRKPFEDRDFDFSRIKDILEPA